MKVGHAQGQRPRAGTYFGKGAVDWLQQHIAACNPEKYNQCLALTVDCCLSVEANNPVQRMHCVRRSACFLKRHACERRVIVNATLNGVQHRNLEQSLG